jgi:hypothetical protein
MEWCPFFVGAPARRHTLSVHQVCRQGTPCEVRNFRTLFARLLAWLADVEVSTVENVAPCDHPRPGNRVPTTQVVITQGNQL